MTPFLRQDGITVYNADSRRLPDLIAPETFGAIITDPPYELGLGTAGRVHRWDSTGIAFDPSFWASLLPLVKPGSFLLAFGSPRTWHRLVCALEDAGWRIHDQIAWLYASGLPKGEWGDHAVDKALGHRDDRPVAAARRDVLRGRAPRAGEYEARDERAKPWAGHNPTLKPAWEPIVVAQRPREATLGSTLLTYGTGMFDMRAAALDADMDDLTRSYSRAVSGRDASSRAGSVYRGDDSSSRRATPKLPGRHPSNVAMDGTVRAGADMPAFMFTSKASGMERVTSDETMLAPGRGDAWETACARLGLRTDADAYPASVLDEETRRLCAPGHVERVAHPCVKPQDLMRWLVRLAAPAHLPLLDPFAGSGSTLQAARLEGREAVGVELEPSYLPIIRTRLAQDLQPSLGI